MNILIVVTYIILVISVLGMIYSFFQFGRNDAVYRIRIKWIDTRDPRYYQYTYDEMFDPGSDNYWGLTIPKEEDFVDKED